MEKVLLEYEQSQCSKLKKAVTITSMVIQELDQTASSCSTARLAFDCDQKNSCGVLTVLGKSRRVNWAGCSHPKLVQNIEVAFG
jgi:hypothetical protein